jgi:uncharacterized protein
MTAQRSPAVRTDSVQWGRLAARLASRYALRLRILRGRSVDPSVNVFGETLQGCNDRPKTGFFRDGCCNTSDQDTGSHTVCVEVTQDFLEFSRFRGNDLSTARPEFNFPGLKPGDRWCLCAARWLEAHEQGMAPRVLLRGTHSRALEIVPLALLKKFAVDLN